jgi:hypothetical protein
VVDFHLLVEFRIVRLGESRGRDDKQDQGDGSHAKSIYGVCFSNASYLFSSTGGKPSASSKISGDDSESDSYVLSSLLEQRAPTQNPGSQPAALKTKRETACVLDSRSRVMPCGDKVQDFRAQAFCGENQNEKNS